MAALSQRVDVCQSGSPQTVAPSIAYCRLPSSPGKKLSEVAADDQHEEVTFAWVRHGKKNSLIFLSLLPPPNIVKSKKKPFLSIQLLHFFSCLIQMHFYVYCLALGHTYWKRLWAAISCQIGSIEHLQGCRCCLITNRKSKPLPHSQGPRKNQKLPRTR